MALVVSAVRCCLLWATLVKDKHNSWESLNPGELLEQIWFGRIWVALGD